VKAANNTMHQEVEVAARPLQQPFLSRSITQQQALATTIFSIYSFLQITSENCQKQKQNLTPRQVNSIQQGYN